MVERACETVYELIPELALGVSDGLERAAVLAHVERCPACRAELASLIAVGDAVAGLAPAVEPPAGFETRVLEALGQAAPARRWRRAVAALAVAAAVAALGGSAGWLIRGTGPGGITTANTAQTAALQFHGRSVGQVVVAAGSDPTMTVSVDPSLVRQTLHCEVVTTDGRTVDLGTFSGYPYWAVPLPKGIEVRSARLLVGHRVVATATVTT